MMSVLHVILLQLDVLDVKPQINANNVTLYLMKHSDLMKMEMIA